MSEIENGINLPYMKWGGEWEILENKEYGPATAIKKDEEVGVAASAPVRGEGGDRHEIRKISVSLLVDSNAVITVAYFDYIENARKWISARDREIDEIEESEWMDSSKTPTEYLEDGRIVLVKPEREHVPSTETLGNRRLGGYAGALQAHEGYEIAESRWDLHGFETLRDRVRTVEKRLKSRDLQSIAEDL